MRFWYRYRRLPKPNLVRLIDLAESCLISRIDVTLGAIWDELFQLREGWGRSRHFGWYVGEIGSLIEVGGFLVSCD